MMQPFASGIQGMAVLSKSKIMAFRQCPKRLWLEVHHPELREDSAQTQASFAMGHAVGDVARQVYDPQGVGVFIDVALLGFPGVFEATRQALAARRPVFEAAFTDGQALALADVLLPVDGGQWRMVEVKSSTSVKPYHRDDVALQARLARSQGIDLAGVSVAHVDSSWVHPGGGDYRGLLTEVDLTEEALGRDAEAGDWVARAQAVAFQPEVPPVSTGAHCSKPYECGFYGHCSSQEPQAEYPVAWLPRLRAGDVLARGITDMRQLPAASLDALQFRVRHSTLTQEPYFDRVGAQAALARHPLPAYFLDFETIGAAVPLWAGTRPYQQVPFQYSLHHLDAQGQLSHSAFLDLSGADPALALARQLVTECGDHGPIFVYNISFESGRIAELATRFPQWGPALQAIRARLVDLLPITRSHYYHPMQHGSWSIKAVLPAMVPELGYDALGGVQSGGQAQEAYLEAVDAATSPERRQALEQQLLRYCQLDTYAMVRIWQLLAQRIDWNL